MKRVRLALAGTRYLARAVQLVWRSGPGLMTGSAAVMLLEGVVPVIPLYAVKLIVDAMAAGEPFQTMLPLIVVVGAAYLLTALLQSLGGYVREAQSHVLSDYMQGLIHEKSLELDLGYYERPQFFDTLHRAQEEAPYRPAAVVDALMTLVRSGISIVGIAGILFYTLPWYVVAILAAAALPPAIVRLVASGRLYAWRKSRTAAERHVYYLNYLLTARPSAKEIRLFGLGGLLKERAREWRDRLRHESLRLIGRRSIGEFFAAAVQAVVLAGLLGYFTYDAVRVPASLGNLVLFFQAVQKGQQVLGELFRSLTQLHHTNLFLSYVFDFLDLTPSLGTNPAPPEQPSGSGGIEMDHVTFSYPGTELTVLDDVSLAVRPGQVVALVGDNGAGKSTLIKLLCRFYDPLSGTIRMDGRDVRTLDEDALHARMAVLFQDHVSYHYTVRENIRFGDIACNGEDGQLTAAARRAHAHGFVEKLPQGYETPLGRFLEEGSELSGGQWKKLALARALYRDAPFLVLDEPTEGLDPDSQAQFIDDLRSLARGRSLLVISHKLASARQADRVYVMREGRIIEEGSHDDLVALDGYYAGLYRTQLRQIQTGAP